MSKNKQLRKGRVRVFINTCTRVRASKKAYTRKAKHKRVYAEQKKEV